MTEQQQAAESRPLSQGEIRIRERLKVLKIIAYRTMVSISTMDEPSVYTVMAGREMLGETDTRTEQNAIDLINILKTVANKDGIQEFLEAGGVIPVIRGKKTTGGWYSLVLAGNLTEGGEGGKVGPTIIMDSRAKDNVKGQELPYNLLNEERVRMVWGNIKKDNVLSYAHQLVHELAHFKPKGLLYDLVKALR